jgi:predicted nucleotidyltransferase
VKNIDMLSDIEKDKLRKDIIRVSGIHPSRIFNIFLFGSRVYGTSDHKSDWDIIMVANNSVESTEISHPLYNIHILTPNKFQADLDWHRMNALECYFAPDWAKLKEDKVFKFELNKAKLRHATSHISSNSWVKAKKKLEAGEERVALKSLFHSIRIPMFASQIASNGKITNFEIANFIWRRLTKQEDTLLPRLNDKWDWNSLVSEFRSTHNLMLSMFRNSVNNEK